jgi:hypothetical protein
MAADRIDSTLVAPIVPRTLVTPQRDRVAQQGTGDEVSISREARVLQALDTQANAEVYDEQPRRPELQRYLEAQSGTEQPAGNGQIIEGQYQQKALLDPGIARRDGDDRSVLAQQRRNPQNQLALQAYQEVEFAGTGTSVGRIDLFA